MKGKNDSRKAARIRARIERLKAGLEEEKRRAEILRDIRGVIAREQLLESLSAMRRLKQKTP